MAQISETSNAITKFVVVLGLSVASLSVSGCDNQNGKQVKNTKLSVEDSPSVSNIVSVQRPFLVWTKFGDGSQIAYVEDNEGYQGIIRCWNSKAQQDCISAYGDNDWVNVRRTISADLPKLPLSPAEIKEARNGYDCDVAVKASYGFQEHISGRQGKLTSKVESGYGTDIGKSWSARYVSDFLKANQVEPDFIRFDCRAVFQIVNGNSLAAIGSSKLRYNDIG